MNEDKIVAFLELVQSSAAAAALAVKLTPTATDDAVLAITSAISQVILNAIDAHQKATGQKIDLALLHQIEPIA